jgi:hypothetical protein
MRNTEGKHFETELPAGFRAAYSIDATNKKTVILMNLAALAIAAAVMVLQMVLIGFGTVVRRFRFTVAQLLLFIGVAPVYVVLHELVHGLVYWLFTGHKLKFGFTGTVAYCGVPDIYVYRTASMCAVIAPFAVFTVIFALGTILFKDPVMKILAALLQAIHVSGCVGDLFNFGLYLFKFRDPRTLMRDPGPAQTFYLPAAEADDAAGSEQEIGNKEENNDEQL